MALTAAEARRSQATHLDVKLLGTHLNRLHERQLHRVHVPARVREVVGAGIGLRTERAWRLWQPWGARMVEAVARPVAPIGGHLCARIHGERRLRDSHVRVQPAPLSTCPRETRDDRSEDERLSFRVLDAEMRLLVRHMSIEAIRLILSCQPSRVRSTVVCALAKPRGFRVEGARVALWGCGHAPSDALLAAAVGIQEWRRRWRLLHTLIVDPQRRQR